MSAAAVGADLTGSRFQRVNLAGSRFRLAQLSGAELRGCEFADTRFRMVGMTGVTDDSLDAETKPVEAPGLPESRGYRLRNVLHHLFHEEWEHRLYAKRDLDALEARGR